MDFQAFLLFFLSVTSGQQASLPCHCSHFYTMCHIPILFHNSLILAQLKGIFIIAIVGHNSAIFLNTEIRTGKNRRRTGILAD